MIVYDKEQKQIVIPNGLGNVNIVINQGGGDCPDCTECPDANIYDASSVQQLLMDGHISYDNVYLFKGEITEIQRIRPEYGDARYTLDGSLNVYNGQTMGYDIQVGDNVIVIGTLSEYKGAPQLSAGSMIKVWWREGGSGEGCNLEDKFVEPTVDDVRDGYLYVDPSEGYDGMYRAVVQTGNLRKSWYDEGYNEGQAGGGGGCTLTTRTITENGTYRANEGFDLGMIDFSQNGAFNSLLKVSENTTIEFYFAFKEERPDLMSFYGCEDSDWQDTTFAARYYSGGIEVKMGSFVRNFNVEEYELADGRVHKMKVGKNYGISIDDRMLVTHQDILNDGITFEPSSTRTIYIGAINSPDVEDNGLGLFWRPFNGYIGPVTIVGDYEGFGEQTFNYETGDYGWWGEYRIIQTGQRLENIYREPGATPLERKRYYPNADGFSEVTVNLRMETRDIRMDSKRRTEAAGWYGLAGFSEVNIDATDLYNTAADEGRRFIIGSLEELNVSENGTYEAPGIYDEYKETHKYVENTGSFVTDFRPDLNDTAVNDGGFEIEVQAKVNSSEGGQKFIVGCAAEHYWENAGTGTVINNVVLKANVDATSLFMSGCKTYNMPTINDEWVTYRITENGLDYKRELAQEWEHLDWEGDTKPRDVWNDKGNDCHIAIGGLNTFYDGLFNEFQGSIRYVRIKQGEYEKVWLPDGGQMRAEGTDDFLNIQDGEAPDFVMDAFKTGSQGWKKVNVRVRVSVLDYNTREFLNDWFVTKGYYDLNETVNSNFQNVVVNGVNNGVLENIFPGHYVPYSGEALVPHFIESFMTDDENAKTVKIGRLVKDITSSNNYVNGVYSINRFNCINVESVDIEAFKGMVGLKYLGGFVNIGYSFSEPQTIDFSIINIYASRWRATDSLKELAESLYDFTTPNKNGVSGSTIKFKTDAESIEQNAEGFEILRRKGWTIEFV